MFVVFAFYFVCLFICFLPHNFGEQNDKQLSIKENKKVLIFSTSLTSSYNSFSWKRYSRRNDN